MSLNYTTTNAKLNGRASVFFRSMKSAEDKMVTQNTRAEKLGIKARYQIATCDDTGIAPSDIRK